MYKTYHLTGKGKFGQNQNGKTKRKTEEFHESEGCWEKKSNV